MDKVTGSIHFDNGKILVLESCGPSCEVLVELDPNMPGELAMQVDDALESEIPTERQLEDRMNGPDVVISLSVYYTEVRVLKLFRQKAVSLSLYPSSNSRHLLHHQHQIFPYLWQICYH